MERDAKINICHLASGDLWAGAEVQIFTMLSLLKSIPDLQISAILLNEGKLASNLRAAGFDIYVIDESKNNFLEILRKTIKILNENKIQILHTHRYKENILGAFAKKRCKRISLVQTVHGASEPFTGLKKINSIIYSKLNKFMSAKYFDCIIAVSHDLERHISLKRANVKIMTVHNSIDIQSLKIQKCPSEIKRALGFSNETILIGSAGRMMPVKGYDIFIEMAAAISEKYSQVKFILVGDGPLKRDLMRKAKDKGLGDIIAFPGFRDDIIDIINALDIFVMTSHHEGIPMALLEAMGLHKAIVSTAVGGITEVIEDNISGLTVDSRNPLDLASACMNILEDNNLKQRLGDGAFRRVLAEFSGNNQKNRLYQLYSSLAQKL